jgi:hypothetical protein
MQDIRVAMRISQATEAVRCPEDVLALDVEQADSCVVHTQRDPQEPY